MKNKLFIYFNQQESVPWLLCDKNGTVIQQLSYAPLTALADQSTHAEVIVIVPAEDVLLTSVHAAGLSHEQFLKFIPSAVEEELLDKTSEYFFATPELMNKTKLPVAVVRQQTMRKWIDRLQTAKIIPHRIIPAFFTLTTIEKNWHVYIDDGMSMVRTGLEEGFVIDNAHLLNVMSHTLQTLSATRPEKIILDNHDNYLCDLSALSLPIQINKPALPLLEQAVQTCWQTQPINLLQQQYSAKSAQKLWQVITNVLPT